MDVGAGLKPAPTLYLGNIMDAEQERLNFKDQLETAWRLTLKYIAPLIILTLVMFLVCLLTLGVLSLVLTAGYFHAVLLRIRDCGFYFRPYRVFTVLSSRSIRHPGGVILLFIHPSADD
jgi:hypothetical protein